MLYTLIWYHSFYDITIKVMYHEEEVNPSYANAFIDLISKSVAANFTEEYTILFDENFIKYLPSFVYMVNQKKMKMSYIYLPNSYQHVIQNTPDFYEEGEIQLPGGIKAAISQSSVVLNFLTGEGTSSKVRGAVLNNITDYGSRIIHCPHLNDEILATISVSDFEKVHEDCELMAWALGNCQMAVLITEDPVSGKQFELTIPLGGWENDPFISAGLIAENSWGNGLPGESFWCPPEKCAINGAVCINGSVPGYLFKPGEYLIITFYNGKATRFEPIGAGVEAYVQRLAQAAARLHDTGWDKFAELGIGMNPAITALRGNPLFDEKMAGSIHVALGDNVSFGHKNQSHMHEDLVILEPTFILDDMTIIDKGKIDFTCIRNKRRDFVVPSLAIESNTRVAFHTAKFDTGNKYIRMLKEGNRIGHVDVGLDKDHNLILFLDKYFTRDDNEIQFSHLVKHLQKCMNADDIKAALETLIHYRMAEII